MPCHSSGSKRASLPRNQRHAGRSRKAYRRVYRGVRTLTKRQHDGREKRPYRRRQSRRQLIGRQSEKSVTLLQARASPVLVNQKENSKAMPGDVVSTLRHVNLLTNLYKSGIIYMGGGLINEAAAACGEQRRRATNRAAVTKISTPEA